MTSRRQVPRWQLEEALESLMISELSANGGRTQIDSDNPFSRGAHTEEKIDELVRRVNACWTTILQLAQENQDRVREHRRLRRQVEGLEALTREAKDEVYEASRLAAMTFASAVICLIFMFSQIVFAML